MSFRNAYILLVFAVACGGPKNMPQARSAKTAAASGSGTGSKAGKAKASVDGDASTSDGESTNDDAAVAPTLTAVASKTSRAGAVIELAGSGFNESSRFLVGEQVCTPVKISPTTATCTVQSQPPGPVDATVVNSGFPKVVLKQAVELLTNLYLYSKGENKVYAGKLASTGAVTVLGSQPTLAGVNVPDTGGTFAIRNGNKLMINSMAANKLQIMALDEATGKITGATEGANGAAYDPNAGFGTKVSYGGPLYQVPGHPNLLSLGGYFSNSCTVNPCRAISGFGPQSYVVTTLFGMALPTLSFDAAANTAQVLTPNDIQIYSKISNITVNGVAGETETGSTLGPMSLAFGGGGKVVYVPHKPFETYAIGADGALSLQSHVDIEVNLVAASGDGAHVFAGKGGGTALYAFSADPATGALTPAPGSPLSVAELHAVRPLAGSKFVFVAAGPSSVFVYATEDDGSLHAVDGKAATIRAGMTDMKIDASGSFLVLTYATAPSLVVLAIDRASGALSPATGAISGLPDALQSLEVY